MCAALSGKAFSRQQEKGGAGCFIWEGSLSHPKHRRMPRHALGLWKCSFEKCSLLQVATGVAADQLKLDLQAPQRM